MFKSLKNLFSLYKRLNFYNKFTSYGFDEYIKTFQNYYYQEPQLWQTGLNNLKQGLDNTSIQNIESFTNTLLSLPLPSQNFLIKKDVLFTKEQQIKIKEDESFYKTINQYYKLYNLQGFEKLEVNVFKYHCGLKLLPKNILKKLFNTTFIDGGAFWGDSALVFNKYYTPNKIICFEPNSINFNLLKQTISNNNLNSNILPFQLGLGNSNEEALLNYISHRQNHGASVIFKPYKLKQEHIKLTSLDVFVKQHKIDNIGLLKLDVEGCGLQAIEGSQETIKNYKPIISCAIYHNPEELLYIKPKLQQLNSNYKFIIAPLLQKFILKELTLIAY